ncbi:SIR2 family protein [uncultured Pseudokineococcus sp.]|uniref:SIR2 family NAD-dependent protein deacylase n=1 Tax=uncultured Pseudokineococcus sp. TaxID=1642928 RepID=UPI00262FA7ED|nr:SIR2 family protein [uncultured Pseudokineococcus sp.]
MTTNYDKIYERFWEQLASKSDPEGEEPAPLVTLNYYDDGLIDNLRSERRLLLKLHGTAEAADRIILSRSQYAHGRHQYAGFFAGVSALLLTRTVLFIGMGFSGDPDVDLLLEDAAFMARARSQHYALVPQGRSVSELQSLGSAFNVQAKEYVVTPTGGHDALLEALNDLCKLVEGVREAS